MVLFCFPQINIVAKYIICNLNEKTARLIWNLIFSALLFKKHELDLNFFILFWMHS